MSEYNILWHDNRPVIIDVSQSVEHSHPLATEFLRKDINNITDFFGKKGVYVLSNFELFKFITDKYLLVPEGSGNGGGAEDVQLLLVKAQELLDASEVKREAEEEEVQAGYETAMASCYDGVGVGHDNNDIQGNGTGDRDVATIAYHAAVLKSEEVN